MTEKQKRVLKSIGQLAAYTAITGGAYILTRGALSLLLKQMKPKDKAKEAIAPPEKAKAAFQHVGPPPKS